MISTHNTHSINHTQSLLDSTARTIIHTPAIHQYHAPISSSLPVTIPQPPDTFDSILASSNLPPPGPDHYVARRALWLTPRFPASPRSPEPSTSRKRLEKVLSSPNAVESNAAWKNGIEDVWKGLSSGGRLKRRLPMSLIVCAATHTMIIAVQGSPPPKIKVTHAAWIRDQTWPMGAVAPEPDDILFDGETPSTTAQEPSPVQTSMTEYSSGAATPWVVVNGNDGKPDNDDSASAMTGR